MSITIDLSARETAPGVVRAIGRALQIDRVGPIIGRSANNTIREHLFGLNSSRPNALGGSRTNYYAQAARATQFQVEGESVIVSINQIGIAQRYFGGTIKPKKAKYLTIPARAEAHGKRAGEFNDLVVVFGRGGQPIGLARAWQTKIGQNKSGQTVSRGIAGGEILFWLVKEVTQQADKSVLPEDGTMTEAINRDVASYLDRITQRAGENKS